MVDVTFFHVFSPVVQVPFVEKIFLSPLNCLGTFLENQLTLYVCGFISGLFVLMMYLSNFKSAPHCLDYCKMYSNPLLDFTDSLLQRPKT